MRCTPAEALLNAVLRIIRNICFSITVCYEVQGKFHGRKRELGDECHAQDAGVKVQGALGVLHTQHSLLELVFLCGRIPLLRYAWRAH